MIHHVIFPNKFHFFSSLEASLLSVPLFLGSCLSITLHATGRVDTLALLFISLLQSTLP